MMRARPEETFGSMSYAYFALRWLVFVVLSVFGFTAYAERFVSVNLDKRYPGMAGVKYDPKVCQLYLENLNHLVKKNVSLQCGRPIAPHLRKRIQELEWEDIEPEENWETFKQVSALRGNVRHSYANACNIIKRLSESYPDDTVYPMPSNPFFQRSKYSWHGAVIGNEDDDRNRRCEHTGQFYFVRYSENSPEDNDLWPCKRLSDDSPIIYNNDPSLFVVDSAMNVVRELDSPAHDDPRGNYKGQVLRRIDQILYWEVAYDGEVHLYRVNLKNQFNMEATCEFKLVKPKRPAQTSRE